DEHGIKYKDRIYVGKDGRSIIAMTDDTITENFVVTSFQDITELREAENEKEEMARRDPATDFYNIRHLKAELGELIRRSKATGKTASVLMINLDSFEEHRNIADEFAIAMEGKIAESLSEIGGEDPYTITYVGNGVFGVIVRGDDKQAVLKKNTRITRIIPRKLKQIVSCGGKSYTLHGTISIGISVFPEDGKDVKDLIHSANLALEDSREQEGNTAVYCNDELMRKDKRRRDLTRRLQSALLDPDENGFFLNFQRKIDVKTGEIVGREVYTRWNDPEIRWVTPNEFIPIAEEQGWIGCLTEWVLLEACRKTRAWQDRGHYVSAAVNISVRDLQREDPNLVLSIKKILEETGVDPSLLRLELTEREDINVEQIAPTLHELRKLGIGIDIDDYGRGQDRLGELPDLPFDKLKLDMAFMIKIRKDLEKAREKGIDVDAIIADIVRILGEEELPESVKTEEQVKIWEKLRDRIAIISSTIDLTHKMKKKIIAESVETEEQLALLKNLGCDEAQGFYIGMPETSEQIDEELEREKSDSPPETRGKVWRDVRYTEEMLLCLIEEMISLGFNKEIVLAFDADIGTDQVVNPLDGVLAALSNLKQNPRYAPILKNLKIITASPENMRSSIEETAGKDAEVFMFSRYRHHVKLAGLELEERVHAVYIDELIEEGREFGKRAYYPLAEIVVISIAQAIAPIIAKNKITTVLKVPGLEDIVLHDINIESVLQKGNTLFFTLLPDAKEYDMSELIKKYAELKRFLKAA
ncbi:MAG: EAL domain-containing protein, partial [Candidatus Omnitrophota bacterium]